MKYLRSFRAILTHKIHHRSRNLKGPGATGHTLDPAATDEETGMTTKRLNAEHRILRADGPDSDLGYPATVELADGGLFTLYYQKAPGNRQCSLLSSHWRLPRQ